MNQPRRDSILRIDWNINSNTQFYWRGINDYEAFKGEFDFVLASSSWPQLPINYQIQSDPFCRIGGDAHSHVQSIAH